METVNIIGRIYESVGDSEAFLQTIEEIARFSRSRSAQFGIMNSEGKWLQAEVVGTDVAVLESYLKTFAAFDPRLPYLLQHPGRWIPCQETISDTAAFERSALVNEFLNKHDARYALPAFFSVGPQHSAILSFMRGRHDGQYGEQEIRQLSPLLPHMRRAMNLSIRIGSLEANLASIEAIIDRLSTPVLLVGRTGALRFANSSGQEALRQGRFLLLRDGNVRPRNGKQAQQFMDVLENSLSSEPAEQAGGPSDSMRLLGDEGQLAVLVVQTLRGHVTLRGMPRTDAILFLLRADGEVPLSTSHLRTLFRLTPAETRLAQRLVGGKNLNEIGDELGVSRETLKSQMRSLFDKTDTRRQGELVARLLSLLSIPIT